MNNLSVIICTHNPREDYLRQTLNALKAQTLPKEQWELLLIDNDSKEAISSKWDLIWHPNARHIREGELGLTHARLRGIKESKGELLVFVDDDNVLSEDYLDKTREIFYNFPHLGIWGGQISAIFETPPPLWIKDYIHLLACRSFERDWWSNIPTENESLPCGAGLCVRRHVASAYSNNLIDSPMRKLLGRKGKQLNSAEDTDMAFTACDLGFGMGEFCTLKLSHLIPSSRLSEDYLVKIWGGMVYSSCILFATRGVIPPRRNAMRLAYDLLKSFRLNKRARRFYLAKLQSERRASRDILELNLIK